MTGKKTALACVVLLLAVAGPTRAQIQGSTTDEAKTLKERLSDKASDEQRVNDCRVPVDRRGPTARPDCATGALSASESTRR